MNFIGSGTYGQVHSDGSVAIKTMKLSDNASFNAALKEINTLRILYHPCLIRCNSISVSIGATVKKSSIGATMDLYSHNMDKWIQKTHPHGLDIGVALEIFKALASAVAYMHMFGICHLDLKPSNVLVCDSGVAICDFGCSTYRELTDITNIGTVNCRPPENFVHLATKKQAAEIYRYTNSTEIYNDKTDSFGLGCILFYILTGKDLLYPTRDYEVKLPITSLTRFVCNPEKYIRNLGVKDDGAVQILCGLLHPNPDKRVSILDMYKPLSTCLVRQILVNPVNRDTTELRKQIKMLRSLPSVDYRIIAHVLDILFRLYIVKGAITNMEVVAACRIVFTFYHDNEMLVHSIWKTTHKDCNLCVLSIVSALNGYLIIDNPFLAITDLEEFESLYLSIIKDIDRYMSTPTGKIGTCIDVASCSLPL